jgi:hypothetical protein
MDINLVLSLTNISTPLAASRQPFPPGLWLQIAANRFDCRRDASAPS